MGKATKKKTEPKQKRSRSLVSQKATLVSAPESGSESDPINVRKCPRFDYSKNHQDVENYVVSHLKQHYVLPTQKQIAEELKISEKTVQRHSQELSLENFMPQYKSLSPKVMLGLFSKALKGNPLAVKLWMQLVEGWSEKTIKEHQNPGMEQLMDKYLKMSEAELEQEYEKIWAEKKN